MARTNKHRAASPSTSGKKASRKPKATTARSSTPPANGVRKSTRTRKPTTKVALPAPHTARPRARVAATKLPVTSKEDTSQPPPASIPTPQTKSAQTDVLTEPEFQRSGIKWRIGGTQIFSFYITPAVPSVLTEVPSNKAAISDFAVSAERDQPWPIGLIHLPVQDAPSGVPEAFYAKLQRERQSQLRVEAELAVERAGAYVLLAAAEAIAAAEALLAVRN
ncbi:hypothetical protein BJ508DRAFT_333195 [Ascobolus immersus RN42]|uniref:Uncharacterized protein n=1 Tax=Ascobolus immersus RN42 TaxID=1160509 RepID=A0A3N4HP79_ASCIM|nr:hypothetical protein BJ508DRAFT_333195 [Ascobolus immersus RN42]